MAATWKRFYFSRRHAALTLEQFPERWRRHSRLGATFPDGLKRHTRLNYALVDPAHSPTDARQYDGIGILWLGSPAMLDRVNDDPLCTPTMRRDELFVFSQPVYDSAMVAEERIGKDGPLTKFALLRFMRRAQGVTDDLFGKACEAVSGAVDRRVSRFAWGTVVRPPTIDFDCFMEFWFETHDDAVRAKDDPAFAAMALQHDAQAQYVVQICHERATPPC